MSGKNNVFVFFLHSLGNKIRVFNFIVCVYVLFLLLQKMYLTAWERKKTHKIVFKHIFHVRFEWIAIDLRAVD